MQKVHTLPAQVGYFEEQSLKQEAGEFSNEEVSDESNVADTVSSSIPKYNYLFYFIYKYKYENTFGAEELEKLVTD